MLIDLIRFGENFALPPGLLILVGVVAAVGYRRRAAVRRTLLLGSALLYLASLPWLGGVLMHHLEWTYHPPRRLRGQVLLMLGEGAAVGMPSFPGSGALSQPSSMELLTTLALYRRTHLPVLISGGTGSTVAGNEALTARAELERLGVPERKIFIDPFSHTTYENARDSAALMRRHHWRRAILIVSAFHAPRAVYDFRLLGVAVQPFPTDYTTPQRLRVSWLDFAPTAGGLSTVSTALHEYLSRWVTAWGVRV